MSKDIKAMNGAKEILDAYTAEFVEEPKLKEWVCPDFYRTSYHYTEKKIAKEKAKNDEQYRKEYEREMAAHQTFLNSIQKILSCPDRLAHFFATSMRDFIERTREHRAMLSARVAELEKFFDRDFDFTFKSGNETVTLKYNVKREAWYFLRLFDKKAGKFRDCDATDRTWCKFCAAFPTEEGRLEFIKKHGEYDKAKSELTQCEHASEAFCRLVDNIGGRGGIVDKMVQTLGGMPDYCSYDTDWGVGGYYNGIVGRGEKRASFKSFYAGGWNIQRLHIRFRVTLLKH